MQKAKTTIHLILLCFASVLRANTLAQTSNDNFANATLVSYPGIISTANSYEATLEEGEPISPEQNGSLWYRWSVAETGLARISVELLESYTPPTTFSTKAALSDESIFYPWGGIWYPGDGGNGDTTTGVITTIVTPVYPLRYSFSVFRGTALNNLVRVTSGTHLEFNVQAGETIWISLETFPLGFFEFLPDSFDLDLTPFAANDSFANGFSVADSAGGTLQGHLLGATRESSEPNPFPDYSGNSVWFHYTAATYGTVTIEPGDLGVTFAVFIGDEISNLKLIASTQGGSVSFFGEPGICYHIAVYGGSQYGFILNYSGPTYRLYETTLDTLMPNRLVPHFYGLRGNTMLLYTQTSTGWDCVEIEPITDFATELLIYPSNALDGNLRVITIDDTLSSPHVNLRPQAGQFIPELIGYPGQTCAISYSSDLISWSTPQIHTLDSISRSLPAQTQSTPAYFYRITQSLPQTNAPKKQLEPPH